ncbi:electron transfer flavoprotein subunit alpha/FixB family protein [Domibacillus sp. DTU_2020_1001157_1_SI_ALB_TIR_016]|uniref:electron transfer flavoprotein subunit alpha/FixB family protein n=1 Tax=Domibacillus sp. DTU_2020_1001157_1_SI_ALB_TIR_016 TaxID=3077789 RepID=UPI0028E6D5D0|nr:electron transfer flavoprotein subunit alpha/FixB family protein [Domibacillus sp. DTU_2020_1001157_1_SI_ALB_TIR_016]WNS81775.1 electron transfer flavoprotein subunit alpha/FixB family protein [Domibacillus sp. DTU_2020_1001157_1_SI_ALB_TIR_016]
MPKKIMAVGEIREGQLRRVSFETIAAAKAAAEGGEVVGVLIGKEAGALAEEMIQYGADRVRTAEDEKLGHYTPDGFASAIIAAVEQEQPDGIFFGHTALGKDLAPKIAAQLDAGLVSDVTALEVRSGEVVFTRPIYAGKAFQKVTVPEGLLLAAIRPNNIEPCPRDRTRSGDVSPLSFPVKDIRVVIEEIVRKSAGSVDLSEAKVIVAGGRGVKSTEGFRPLQELADVLGGAVGASRGACDAGYCDYSLQIGQTGKVVTPDLYIACGISGAIQHLAGMSNSKVIVAVNKDPDAEIFKVADYGIVGDLFEVVPMLTEELKKIKAVSP